MLSVSLRFSAPHQHLRQLKKRNKWKHGGMPFAPMHVAQAARDQHARHVALKNKSSKSEQYKALLYDNSTSWMREANARFGEHADDPWTPKGSYQAIARTREMERLQGLGDDEPLSLSANNAHHYSPIDVATHGRVGVYDRKEPPAPYNKLLSRRIAEGRTWPSILGTPDGQIDYGGSAQTGKNAITSLKHPSNMSPSEQRFSAECEYWLRRNFRAIPPHIADHFDFSEFMINQCFVSRRCRDLYIVWSTLSGTARLQHEPLLPQLSPWVVRTIKRRIKNVPNVPKVHWLYDNGATPTELPNKLKHQLRAVHAHTGTSIEQRVDYLRQLDSVQNRLKGIPWFMPYLWAKNQKVEQTQTYEQDHAAVKEMEKKRVAESQRLNDGFASGNSKHVA